MTELARRKIGFKFVFEFKFKFTLCNSEITSNFIF